MSPAELSHVTIDQTASHQWKEKAPNLQQGSIKPHCGTSVSPEGNTGRTRSLCSSYCFPHTTLAVLAAALWKHSRLWHRTGFSQWYSTSGNYPLTLCALCISQAILLRIL